MRELLLGKVYPITDHFSPAGLDHVEQACRFLDSGIRFFQVRDRDLSDLALYRQLIRIRELCRKQHAQFVVNDRVDLALAAEADGVHLGQSDLPVEAARRLLGKQAIIGLSTHNRLQLEEAQPLDIDYVGLGPVFPSSTKRSTDVPLGTAVLPELVSLSRHPVVAIGGISLTTAGPLWGTGLASVAIVSDVAHRTDPSTRLRRYLSLAEETRR